MRASEELFFSEAQWDIAKPNYTPHIPEFSLFCASRLHVSVLRAVAAFNPLSASLAMLLYELAHSCTLLLFSSIVTGQEKKL